MSKRPNNVNYNSNGICPLPTALTSISASMGHTLPVAPASEAWVASAMRMPTVYGFESGLPTLPKLDTSEITVPSFNSAYSPPQQSLDEAYSMSSTQEYSYNTTPHPQELGYDCIQPYHDTTSWPLGPYTQAVDPRLQSTNSPIQSNGNSYSPYSHVSTSAPSSTQSSPLSTTAHPQSNNSRFMFQFTYQQPRYDQNYGQATRPSAPIALDEKSNISDKETRNKAFQRKSRTGHVYTVCPKQEYWCLFESTCRTKTFKACEMKEHLYSVHAVFNAMQCDDCGSSYARPCTYKRHLKEDKKCPKKRSLTTEQKEQGRLRRQIMACFADMTNEKRVLQGVDLMKKCNLRADMRKRKRRVGAFRPRDMEDGEDEEPRDSRTSYVEDRLNGTGAQFTSINDNEDELFSSPLPNHESYSYDNILPFEFMLESQNMTPRNSNQVVNYQQETVEDLFINPPPSDNNFYYLPNK